MKLASIPVCFLILIACGSQAFAQTNWPPFRGADSLGLLELGMNPVAALQASEPPVHAAAKIARPEKLSATIGGVLIRIDGPKLWTLSGIDFQNSQIAVQDSAYGSVLNINGGGILGSAHFLDVHGKPGEVEKEQVSLVQFFSMSGLSRKSLRR